MGDVKWTNEQQNAIDIRNSKTLVAAGAGSGKTAVLVERIIRKIIDDGVDIDKMLIVTFTNAAASEMKERIRSRLYDEVNKNHSLQKQILYLNRSSIMTIDAFCKKAIKDYFYKLDIDPNFKIVDSTEGELLRLEAIDEVLEELYESKDEEILDVLDAYSSNKSDEGLINLILSIHRFIQSCPNPLEWLEEKTNMYNVEDSDFSNTIWGKKIIRYARNLIEECVEEFKMMEEELIDDPDAKNYLLVIQDDILKLEAVRKNMHTWDDYYNAIRYLEFGRLKVAPKMDEDMKKAVQELRKKAKALIIDYLRDKVFISSSNEILDDLKNAYAHARGIKEIICLFDERFKKKKNDKNLLDFADIEHLCLQLFENNKDVLEDYKNKYEEILIDEYQDSNLIQETILNKISNGNVFMVGDVKQSIYKFRQARPELFLEKYSTYAKYTGNADDHFLENKILLFKNFRSNENIIDEVNFIFKNIMFKDTGEIEYTEEEYLKYGATYYEYDGEPAELHLIEKKNEEEQDEDTSSIIEDDIEEKLQLEARVVAKRIKELVGNFEVFDKHTRQKRKARYSDIVILLRATKNSSATFVEELSKKDIPVYADSKSGYFDNTEVQIFLSLLKIIDNPYQDIPLLAVLRSPIGNFDVNELTKIRLYDRKSPFYDAMIIAASQGDVKVKAFIDKLSEWREKSRYLVINELISYLYDDTGYYYYVSLLPHGDTRQNNLKVLLKKATDFEKSSFKGLYNFLTFIDNVTLSSGDFDSPSELSENDDVVRIMSIHKSKGLEFPIVILSGTSKKFNNKDMRNPIICHQDLGFGFDIVDPKLRITYESIPKLALKLQAEQEMLAEEMRILYVAMTRAKEKLIITALHDNVEKKMMEWESPLSKYKISSAKCYSDWISNAVLSTKNNWTVRPWQYSELLDNKDSEEGSINDNLEKSNKTFNISDNNEFEIIDKRFNWKYPYILSTKIPSKLSVSELKRLHNIEDVTSIQKVKEIETPKFIEEVTYKGATYGSLLHNKMEHLDFSLATEQLSNLLHDVEDKKTKSRLEADITKFMQSDLYKDLMNSKRIYREIPFNLSVSAKNVFKFENDSNDDEIMVQGIIDLYYENEEGLVLVDYKSDRLHNANDFINRYKKQLEYYKMALETITHKKVTNAFIYSFEMEKTIKVF
ncbi:MAG: helicase-exonuclease AddAB subunit AddA [Clostridia bacterium]|nr:helicase-exonuclease AddAB subunit AddA [Clostridia bacterium]